MTALPQGKGLAQWVRTDMHLQPDRPTPSAADCASLVVMHPARTCPIFLARLFWGLGNGKMYLLLS